VEPAFSWPEARWSFDAAVDMLQMKARESRAPMSMKISLHLREFHVVSSKYVC